MAVHCDGANTPLLVQTIIIPTCCIRFKYYKYYHYTKALPMSPSKSLMTAINSASLTEMRYIVLTDFRPTTIIVIQGRIVVATNVHSARKWD